MAVIYHPETRGSVEVPDEAVPHYRQSGWVTRQEWAELEALREERERSLAAQMAKAQVDEVKDVPARQPSKAPDKEKQ